MNHRPNIKKLTEQWDSGRLRDCYCLVFSNVYGFRIVWNDEDGRPHGLKNDNYLLTGFFAVLAVYETEEQARSHFSDFIKWAETF